MDYYNLGTYSSPVTTASPDAQLWFDRGLNWTFGFNHEEAVVCFSRAIDADPDCAMAYWGLAYAAGPNYNMPWDLFDDAGRSKALATAYDATQQAMARIETASPAEQALIRALPARYPQRDTISDQSQWDRDFADAMRSSFAEQPDHLDVRSIFVEALLNLTPWKMWDLPTGLPAEGAATVEAQTILEDAMSNQKDAMAHPGILHLYVHLMEMSPTPEDALRAGDVLRTLVPDAGHLVHMPTHIDVLCGQYQDVVFWNQKAVEADLKYYRNEGAFNIYTGYRQHNYHFVIYGALFLGQFEPAMAAARGMAETTPEQMLRIPSPPMADYFESILAMEPHILIRFGRWQDILELVPPEDRDLYRVGTATVCYARALALAALGRVSEAEAAEKVYLNARARVPDTRLLHNNKTVDLLDIATEMLRGEIEYRKGNFGVAFAHLRRSADLEDRLEYDEPWGWMQPTRHALGALLFEQGHIGEAEAVYREDLGLGGQLSRATVNPGNVWSLKGLYDCLKSRDETVEIVQVKQQMDIALARADTSVSASCFCAQAAMA
jgi:tetratricopeptide (TPR) repeat protein